MSEGLIIYDFDDTLVSTNIVFNTAKDNFKQLMAKQGLDHDQLLDLVNHYDIQLVTEKGFVNECFPQALVETYRHRCRDTGVSPCSSWEQKCAALGWWVFEQQLELRPAVKTVLERLGSHFRQVLVTKGEVEHQLAKVRHSSLEKYFEEVHVVGVKSAELFKSIVVSAGISAQCCWSVGNSVKSDINPALLAGLKAVLIKSPSWDFEHADLEAEVPEIDCIGQLPTIIFGDNKDVNQPD